MRFLCLLFVFNCFADPLAMRGWYFYEEPILVEEQPHYKNYHEYNEAVKKEFEEIEYKAIYDPTPENIQHYNQALRTISNNSVRFGLLATTSNWQDPDAGLSLSAPNGAGLQIDLEKQREQIKSIVKKYALFYFIDARCKYCKIEANELKRLELTYNIVIKVISMDGSKLEQYPNPITDNGISKRLGIKEAGELLAFDKDTNNTIIIGFGYIHFDQIIQRIQTLFISGTANLEQYLKQKQPVIINKD